MYYLDFCVIFLFILVCTNAQMLYVDKSLNPVFFFYFCANDKFDV